MRVKVSGVRVRVCRSAVEGPQIRVKVVLVTGALSDV